MLNAEVIKKIEDFVYNKPRSIQEIAQHLGKNWRTADRYVEEISKEFATISSRVFRKGTREALKIVYWSSIEKVSSGIFQEKLEQEIFSFKTKEQFSAFDIYQHVPDKNKKTIIEYNPSENSKELKELKELFEKAEKQVIIFSGNLSLLNSKYKNFDMMKILEELVKKDIRIKIICRIDIIGIENLEKILSLNFKNGKENIEIRHREQPVRAFVIDNKIIRLKEIKEPTGKMGELNKRIFIFYTIKDKEWAEWLSKIFFKMFSQSIDAKKRLEELRKMNYKN
ncbi:MAG: hypothetical protein AABX99_00765 [Nanoarchaeota archaeon]